MSQVQSPLLFQCLTQYLWVSQSLLPGYPSIPAIIPQSTSPKQVSPAVGRKQGLSSHLPPTLPRSTDVLTRPS